MAGLFESDCSASGEELVNEIIRELRQVPEEKLADLYRRWREMRGLQPRPGTGPLMAPRDKQGKEG